MQIGTQAVEQADMQAVKSFRTLRRTVMLVGKSGDRGCMYQAGIFVACRAHQRMLSRRR